MNNLDSEFLNYKFLNNELQNYLYFMALFAVLLVMIWIFKRFAITRSEKWSQRTGSSLDHNLINIISPKAMPFFYFASFQISLQALTFTPKVGRDLNIVLAILLTATATRFIQAIITTGIKEYWIRKKGEPSDDHSYHFLLIIIKIILWSLAVIVFLQNMPIDITPLLTGLGIGGIAIAFAAQAILQDLFSFVTIFLDRPFEIGDFIIIDQFMGTVDKIGIKTTRLCSISGEQLIISNRDLTNSRLRNYKRMTQRRVLFTLDIVYETEVSLLREIPQLLEGIIRGFEETIFDRAHFAKYGPSSLIYEVVYYVKTNEYTVYMNIQQEINFKIKEVFNNKGIDFAYPTQVLYIGNESTQDIKKHIHKFS